MESFLIFFTFPLFQLADCSPDGCSLLLQVCLDEVLLNADVAKSSRLKPELLSTVFKYCLDKPYFSTSFCEALKTVHVSDMFLVKLSNELNLSAGERVGIGLALSDSGNLGLITKGRCLVDQFPWLSHVSVLIEMLNYTSILCFIGQKFSIAEIEEICANPAHVLTNDQIHDIVVFLHQTDGLSKHMDSFTNIISLLNVKEMPFYVPAPIKEGNARPTISSRFEEFLLFTLCFIFNFALLMHISLPFWHLTGTWNYTLVAWMMILIPFYLKLGKK